MKHFVLPASIALISLWTFQQAHYLPAVYFGKPVLTATIAAVLILSALLYRNKKIHPLIERYLDGSFLGRLSPIAGAIALLVLLPVRRMEEPPIGPGDSFHLIEFIPVFSEIYGYLSTPDELLALFVRSKVFLLLQNLTDAQNAIGLYSYFAGVVHLIAVFFFLKNRPDWKSGWLILFFTPVMALYAGYVESYSMARALLFVTIVLGWVSLNQPPGSARNRLVVATAAVAAIAVLHHLLAGLILPALAYMVWKISDGRVKAFLRRSTVAAVVGICILSVVYAGFYLSSQSSLVFADSHVGTDGMLPAGKLFSKDNLSKMAGLLFITPAFLITLLSKRLSGTKNDRDAAIRRFLWIATGPFLFHAFLWNAAIGMPADWDLFTFFAIPLSLLVYHDLSRVQIYSTVRAAVLPLLTVLPAILWLHWLNETTPATLENRQYISYVRTTVIPALKEDRRLSQLPLKRQKMYLRLRLFEEKAGYRMRQMPASGERQKAEQNLAQGMQIFHSGLLESDAAYERKIIEAQKYLFPVYQFLQRQNQ